VWTGVFGLGLGLGMLFPDFNVFCSPNKHGYPLNGPLYDTGHGTGWTEKGMLC
jgi:hypothetical protein